MLNSIYTKKQGLSITLWLCTFFTYGQNNDLEDVVSDFNFLIQNFIEPAAEGIVYQSSSGWYTDAKKLNLWDIKLSAQTNFLLIPEHKKTFLIDNTLFKNLYIQGGQASANIPTAVGGVSPVYIEGTINGNTFEFFPPSGLDQNAVFHAQIQATIGLPYGTSIMLRYTPKIEIGSSNIKALGFGFTHNISQWFPKLEASSFDISTILTYSRYEADDKFSPLELGEDTGFIDSINTKGGTILTGLVTSKAFGAFDGSIGVLYSHSTPDLSFGGEGAILSLLNPVLQNTDSSVDNITVDFGLNYNYKEFSINSIVTIGDFRNVLIGLNYTIKHKSNTKEQNKN